MLLRLCDRCRRDLSGSESNPAYRAVLIAEAGSEQVIAEFEDLCESCVEEIRAAHQFHPKRGTKDERRGKSRRKAKRATPEQVDALRAALVDVVRTHGGQATNDEIIHSLEERGVYIPGSSPRRTVSTYLSRHDEIENVEPGLWGVKTPKPNGEDALKLDQGIAGGGGAMQG